MIPGQGNNLYIFPGIGLGLSNCDSKIVTDQMFYEAAKVVVASVTEDELASGTVYPSLSRIKDVSVAIAKAIIMNGIANRLVSSHHLARLEETIQESMYSPGYPNYL
jgi:malate dehydrogenase (oxaloacetate-decarboxylating)(NADP+)